MNLDKLKELARRHESREDWGRAIEIYQQAVRELADAGEPAEPSLFNRIGDLELKVGNAAAALHAYERAVESYAEQGFFNNAIAVCGKILRVNPLRTATYLRLAELNARKNVVAEARRNLTEYVERMVASGQVTSAIAPLRAFAARFGGSVELRATLAALLRDLEPRVQESALAALAAEMDGTQTSGDEAGDGGKGELIGGLVGEAERLGEGGAAGAARGDAGYLTLPGLRSGPDLSGARQADLAGDLGGTGLVFLDTGPTGPGSAALLEPTALEADMVPEPVELEGFEPTQAGAVADSESLNVRPLVGVTTPEPLEIPGLEPMEEFRAPADGPPARASILQDSVEPPFEGLDAAELDEVEEVDARPEPDEIARCRGQVEQAYRSADQLGLISAYLGLGEALERHGMTANAALVYRRVLEHDPQNGPAAAALRRLSLATAGPDPVPASLRAPAGRSQGHSQGHSPPPSRGGEPDYVDLGALILDPEPERDTRMRVEAPEPVGDEDRDFQETLAQFKQGLEANVEDTDYQTHYDLGIAFQEMGLLTEAIAQFQRALRAPEARLRSAEALGQCFFALGRHAIAEAVLSRAVETLPESDDAKIGLIYWWGRALEALGRRPEALRAYERALAIDITFLDLSERIQRLGMELES